MSKKRFLWICSVLLIFSFLSPALGKKLDLDVKDFTCRDGKYCLVFGVMNHYTYDRNPTIAFKLVRGEQILGCKTVTLNVPAGADGSAIREVYFDLPCEEEAVSIRFRIFERRDRNRVGVWTADCPTE